jgi:hypothetical protein
MNLSSYLIPLAVFLGAILLGGLLFDFIASSLGDFSSGFIGFLISGTLMFAVYVYIVKRIRGAEP